MLRTLDPNGSLRSKPSSFLEVRDLPNAELHERAIHLIEAGTFDIKQGLTALTIVVELVLEGLLRKLNRRGTFLFYGPTGSGKSTLAYLLPQLWAHQTGRRAKLARVNVHAIASDQHGESQKNVARLFDELAELCLDGDPVFACIDELETIATDRAEISGKTSPIDARASVNCVLEQIDRKPSLCFILATTNVERQVDPAVLNRFDFQFETKGPDGQRRIKALIAAVSAINPDSPVVRCLTKSTFVLLRAATKGFSFRELESLPILTMVQHDGDRTLNAEQLASTANVIRKSPAFRGGV